MEKIRHHFYSGSGIFWLGILSMQIIILCSAWFSFQLIKISDVAFMYYNAWLINEQDFFPYRDIMDTSFPGSFLAYSLITNLTGYSDFAFHMADTAILLVLLVMTWIMMRPLGFQPAVFAVISYAAYYFGVSSSMHMQRDYLGILPIVASLILMHNQKLPVETRALLIGILSGMTIAIKPQLGIGFPIMAVGLSLKNLQETTNLKNPCYVMLFVLAGLLISLCALTSWLYANDALDDFFYMVKNLLPLYLTGEPTPERTWSNALNFLYDNFLPFILQSKLLLGTATAGFVWHQFSEASTRQKQYAAILFLMIPAYTIATLAGLKLWNYHAMPMEYFAIILCSLALTKKTVPSKRQQHLGTIVKVMLALNTIIISMLPNIGFISSFDPKLIRDEVEAVELANHLKEHTHPGEKIQLIVSNTSVPIFLILLNEQQIMATRYPLCSFCNSTNNSPAKNLLKTDFSQEVRENSPPTIIIDRNYFGDRELYDELRDLLAKKYSKVYAYGQFEVYDRL